MAEQWKTALCALVLVLTLVLAWIQEMAWTEQTGPGQAASPAELVRILPGGQR